jgi:hypothetical protein
MSVTWRKRDEHGKLVIHLSKGGNMSICGEDLTGDPIAGSVAEPLDLTDSTSPKFVNCVHCREIISVCDEYARSYKNHWRQF